jgi:hypothetical protein
MGIGTFNGSDGGAFYLALSALKLPFSNFIQHRLGIDKAVAYVLLGRGFGIISLPVTHFLIIRCLSPETQGYYYVFFSLLAVSILLEMGLGIVLTQFASHEYAHLRWSDQGLEGDARALSRLFSILRKTLKWYVVMCLVYVLVLIPLGLVFLHGKEGVETVNYVVPWVLFVLLTSFKQAFIPIQAVLEGSGKVAAVQQVITSQAVIGWMVVWVVMLSGGGLYALPALALSNMVVTLVWCLRNFRGFLRQVFTRGSVRILEPVSWRREILPMQWRIGLSWIAGYLLSQLFVPLLDLYQGKVISGRMGMTLQIATAVQTIALAWLNTRIPRFGGLVQQKKYDELHQLLRRSTIQAFCVSILSSLGAFLTVVLITRLAPESYGSRVLPAQALAWLLFSNVINIPIVAMAGYLRAHKEEPFLVNSLVVAVLVAAAALICAARFQAVHLCMALALINLFISLPWAWLIYRRKQRQWGIVA